MKRGDLLAALVLELPPMLIEEYADPACCIPAAYHAFEALRARGIPAKLAPLDVIAGNAAFWAFMDTKPADPSKLPPEAWSVGVTHGNPSPMPGFNSHLCVISKGLILDCAAGQLSRPQHAMTIPPGLLIPHRGRRGLWSWDGAAVSYAPSPEPVPPMWKRAPEATARVRARLRAVLGAVGVTS